MSMLSKLGFRRKTKPDPRYDWINKMVVENMGNDEWYIIEGDGTLYAGPYKTRGAAKGQLTRLKRGYTAAARRDFNDDSNTEA